MAQYHFHPVLLVKRLQGSGDSLRLVRREAHSYKEWIFWQLSLEIIYHTCDTYMTYMTCSLGKQRLYDHVYWNQGGKNVSMFDQFFFLVILYKLFNKCYSKLFSLKLKVNLQLSRLVWYFRHFSNFSFLEKYLLSEKNFLLRCKIKNIYHLSPSSRVLTKRISYE